MDFYSIESKLILLFSILLIGLILCSYLGGQSCLVDGFDIMGTYEDSNKNTATVKTNPNTSNTITVKKPDGTIMSEYTSSVGDASRTFYNPNGAFAKISVDLKKITVTSADKKTITTFNSKTRPPTPAPSPAPAPAPSPTPAPPPATSSSYDNYNHYSGKSYASIYYGPNGATARLIDTGNNSTMAITHQNGATDIYYIDSNTNKKAYYGPNNSFAKLTADSYGKTAIEVTSAYGNKALYTERNMNTFSNMNVITEGFDTGVNKDVTHYDPNTFTKSLPNGVPKADIPSGHEDLYILKSQVVPPVCPACPASGSNAAAATSGSNAAAAASASGVNSSNFDVSKCPPCPPCARCPEPNFDCKKVPNYNAFNPNTMPVPVLNSFGTFGM